MSCLLRCLANMVLALLARFVETLVLIWGDFTDVFENK